MSSETTDSPEIKIQELLHEFCNGTPRKRRSLKKSIEARVAELFLLGEDVLNNFDPAGDDWGAGWILQLLNQDDSEKLNKIFPQVAKGWFESLSEKQIDYSTLQKLLLSKNFEEADRFTSSCLRKLAGPEAESRGYVYFSEVKSFPAKDLETIDRLWIAYSEGRFGFSVQQRILDTIGGRYDLLWPRIGWKQDGVWTRYPGSFNWTLQAPEGHMPLVNQLRGVRLMDALLNHEGLIARRKSKKSLNE